MSGTLTLAEKGGEPPEVITAHPNFRIVATMNSGGDFGKKELSPALANRFTQIWVPPTETAEELTPILQSRLYDSPEKPQIVPALMPFVVAFREWTQSYHMVITIRDLLSVVPFVNALSASLGEWVALVHGIAMNFLDGLEVNLASQTPESVNQLKSPSDELLKSLIPQNSASAVEQASGELKGLNCQHTADEFYLGPFAVSLGDHRRQTDLNYDWTAPTPKRNVLQPFLHGVLEVCHGFSARICATIPRSSGYSAQSIIRFAKQLILEELGHCTGWIEDQTCTRSSQDLVFSLQNSDRCTINTQGMTLLIYQLSI